MIAEANPPKTMTAYRKMSRQLERAADSAEILSDDERRELRENEAAIERGARAWLEMGNALIDIHEKRLYRETHESFVAYCWDNFRLERTFVYGLMAAAKRYQLVLPIASKLKMQFTAESQMRELVKCKAVHLPGALKLAAKRIEPNGDGNLIPTAKILKEAVQQVKGQGPLAPEANGDSGNAHEADVQHGDPAAETVRAMAGWSDSVLMTVARAMARELQTRGLIKAFDMPARIEHKEPSKSAQPRRSKPETAEVTKFF